jgi:multidrug efflux pump subunit AcrA (membrane-fusion protein)
VNKNLLSYALFLVVILELIASTYTFQKKLHTLKVHASTVSIPITFMGVVTPKSVYPVVAPQQGSVMVVKKPYGAWVKKGEPLFLIDSPPFAESFHGALDAYFREKASLEKSKYQATANKELFRLGLVSKSIYADSLGQLQSGELALFEAEQRLRQLLATSGKKNFEYQKLSLANVDAIQKFLQKPLRDLTIFSPAEGILLFPSKSIGLGEQSDSDKKVDKGAQVKEGQVVAAIGDMSGLIFEITVKETDFHAISKGLTATITGVAFPAIRLQGKVISIDPQAKSSSDSSVPAYTAFVVVPQLTAKERAAIEIGMSAEITFQKQEAAKIFIPIGAVMERNNRFFVKRMNQKNQKIEEVMITTGVTTDTNVEIIQGLQTGDEIVLLD